MKALLAFLFCGLFSGGAFSASFDCGAAATATERLVCSDADLSKMDEELAASYKKTLASLDDVNRRRLVAEQKSWLKSSRSLCDDVACLRRSYETRARLLQECHGVCLDLSEEYASNGENHFLMTLRDANARNQSFSKDLSRRKLGAVSGCETLVDIAVGTAHGNHSFGGLCRLGSERAASFFMVCNDEMLGNFKVMPAASGTTRYQLADFTIKNCFGG
ncbi:lysozyme inhibitor LprI family protein [Oxalobacteraceae bacterium OTU3CINTB1]|nr:lysozyme inhibitor LprI family protein [Oxalobacteraceae bacterium OTU3CINTB1]